MYLSPKLLLGPNINLQLILHINQENRELNGSAGKIIYTLSQGKEVAVKKAPQ
jgi:hypothetical protein